MSKMRATITIAGADANVGIAVGDVNYIELVASVDYDALLAKVKADQPQYSAKLDYSGFYPYVVDFYVVTDLNAIGVDKNILGDLVVSSDAINSIGFAKNLAEVQVIADNVITLLTIIRQYSDQLNVSDDYIKTIGKNLTEDLLSSDVHQFDVKKALAEVVNAIDATAADFSGRLDDIAPVGDIVNFVTGYVRFFEEVMSTSDTFDRVVSFKPTLVDTPVALEALAVDFVREPFSDTFGLSDSSIQSLEFTRYLEDNNINLYGYPGTFNELLMGDYQFNGDVGTDRLTTEFGKNLSDSQSAADAFDRVLVWDKSYQDAVGQSEALSYVFGKGLFDQPIPTDVLDRSLVWVRSYQDTVSQSEAQSYSVGKSLSDSNGMSDAFDRVVIWSKSYQDSVQQSETLNYVFGKSLADYNGMSDVLSATLVWQRQLNDSATASDAVAIHMQTLRQDSVSESDSLTSELVSAMPNLFNARIYNDTTFNSTI